MRRKTIKRAHLALLLAGLAALALAASQVGSGESGETGPQEARRQAPIAPGSAGMRVALDPETGALIQRSSEPAAAAPYDRRGSLSTYGRDLVQEALPEGGFKVDLRGRFQSSIVATIDPVTDEVSVDCVVDHGADGGEDDHDH